MNVVDPDDVVSIVDLIDGFGDPRSLINGRNLLGDLIVISICGVLAGGFL